MKYFVYPSFESSFIAWRGLQTYHFSHFFTHVVIIFEKLLLLFWKTFILVLHWHFLRLLVFFLEFVAQVLQWRIFIKNGSWFWVFHLRCILCNFRSKQLLARTQIELLWLLLQHLLLLPHLLQKLFIAVQKIIYHFGSIWISWRLSLFLLTLLPYLLHPRLAIQVGEDILASVSGELLRS